MAANDSNERIDKLTALVEMLIQDKLTNPDESTGNAKDEVLLRVTEVLDRLGVSQTQTAEVIQRAQNQTARASNPVAHMRSVFNLRGETLEGYTKPKLVCPMMLPWRAEDETLTREEVELLNLIAQAPNGLYIIERNDESKVRISVTREMDDTDSHVSLVKFHHETAYRNEYFRTMPPLARALRQMLKQSPDPFPELASQVLTMAEEAFKIEAGELKAAA